MSASKWPPHPSKFPTGPVSTRLPAASPLSSKFPVAILDAHDTGPQAFMDGDLYYRQLDDLGIHMCVAKTISDAQWQEFLEGSLRIARKLGRMPKVTMAAFTSTYPDAKQRRQTTDFLRAQGVKPIERLGILSDNPLVRGAVVAFSWMVPNASGLAFAARDVDSCIDWLHEVAMFDTKRAALAWSEGSAALHLI